MTALRGINSTKRRSATYVLRPAEITKMMRRFRKTGTRPEETIGQILAGLGYKYQLHDSNLPGTPDFIFRTRGKVIFAHGCFWHQHGCRITRQPRTNKQYWIQKFARNKSRDLLVRRQLSVLGWRSLVVWECQLRKATLRRRLATFLESS